MIHLFAYGLMARYADGSGRTAYARIDYNRHRPGYECSIGLCAGRDLDFRRVGGLVPVEDDGSPRCWLVAHDALREAEDVLSRLATGGDPARMSGWHYTPSTEAAAVPS